MGTLVKRFVSQQLGLDPHQIYHCAVMPCYDKKLESSREDFFLPGIATGASLCTAGILPAQFCGA